MKRLVKNLFIPLIMLAQSFALVSCKPSDLNGSSRKVTTATTTYWVSAKITNKNFQGSYVNIPLYVELREVGKTYPVSGYSIYPDINGYFTIGPILTAGTYDIAVKAAGAVRKVKSSQVVKSDLSGIDFFITDGVCDFDGDNDVDNTDLGQVKTRSDAGVWTDSELAKSDYDGDGSIDSDDVDICANNDGALGSN